MELQLFRNKFRILSKENGVPIEINFKIIRRKSSNKKGQGEG